MPSRTHTHANSVLFKLGCVFWISEIKLNFSNPPESTDNHVAVVGGEFCLHMPIFMFFTSLSLRSAAAFCDICPPGSHLAVSQGAVKQKYFTRHDKYSCATHSPLQQIRVYFFVFSSSLCTHWFSCWYRVCRSNPREQSHPPRAPLSASLSIRPDKSLANILWDWIFN